MRCILWIRALLGACDIIIQDGGHIGRHLGFYQKLEIMKKRWKLEIVDVSHVKYDIIKHIAAFCAQFVFYCNLHPLCLSCILIRSSI